MALRFLLYLALRLITTSGAEAKRRVKPGRGIRHRARCRGAIWP